MHSCGAPLWCNKVQQSLICADQKKQANLLAATFLLSVLQLGSCNTSATRVWWQRVSPCFPAPSPLHPFGAAEGREWLFPVWEELGVCSTSGHKGSKLIWGLILCPEGRGREAAMPTQKAAMGRAAVPASCRNPVRLPLPVLQPLPSNLILHPQPFRALQRGKLRYRTGHQVPSPRGCC